MIVLALAASLALAAPQAPPPHRSDPAADAQRAAERDALRALAALAAGEPGIAEVQEAAARVSERRVPEAEGFAGRARLAALLPRITAEVRRDERSYRVVGLQTAGEVDYRHLAPGSAILLRATWELGELVAARGELAAAAAGEARARRRAEAVRRATAAFFERRRVQVELLLAPPEGALARAEAELRVERLAAELDALTGGLLSGRRR
jgi:hypothetical protein